MPAITSPIVSPSCSFKLFFCKSCKQSIDTSTEVKCDDCQNYFHESCLSSNQNQVEDDLIQLCHSCSNENRVYTPSKNKIETKMINNEITTTPNSSIRNLRLRAVSIDSRIIIASKSKSKKDVQLPQTKPIDKSKTKQEAKMKLLESRIDKLENLPCNCLNGFNERIAKVEKSIRENHLMLEHTNQSLKVLQTDYGFIENGYFNLEKKMYTLTTVVAACEAYHDTNTTFDTEIQKQMIDINDSIDKLFSLLNKNTRNANIINNSEILDEIHAINKRVNDLQEEEANKK